MTIICPARKARRQPWFFPALCLFAASLAPAVAQSTLLWKIGKSDQSAKEFPASPVQRLTYHVGSSNWSRDWAATQIAGAPYTVAFPLRSAPSGTCILRVAVQAATPVIPALRVEVNGHVGIFYLDPKFAHSVLAFEPVPISTVTIQVPPTYLQPGANKIVLTPVEIGDKQHSANPPRIKYDYVSLTSEAHNAALQTSAILKPTIFYRERAGQLVEVVDATIRFNGPSAAAQAELTLNGRHFTAPLAAQKDFGEQKVSFEVPEWNGTTHAHLTLEGDGTKDFAFTLEPARKWKFFVVPHTHLDIGYTDYQGKVAEVQARALQDSIQLIRQHPDFRFSTDGSWNVEQFIESRSPALQTELVSLAKDGKIGIPATYANLLTGYSSLETLYRSLYYSKSLARERGIPFNYAAITDVPSYTAAYPSVLANSGIRYLAVGGNGGRGPMLQRVDWNAKSPFWWQGIDGSRVLLWYARGYGQIESVFGLPPELEGGRDTLPLFLSTYTRSDYEPDAALIYGAQSENTQIDPALAGFANQWNNTYTYPKLQYSTFYDFLSYIDEHYSSKLATYKGDMGPYWEDGIVSDAASTAQDRMNQNRIISVEKVSTAAHLLGQGFQPPKAELDAAWKNIELYSEHTWTGGMSVTQPHMERVVGELAFKDDHPVQARFQLEDIANRAMGHLGDQVHVPAKNLIVFNGLNWRRNVFAETDLRKNEGLVDMTTGKEIPVEVLWRREGFTRVRFIVPDVPAVGYKCVQFKLGDTDVPDTGHTSTAQTVENQFYRVTVDPSSGAIRSIYDKQLQREIVDAKSSYKFGQYLYVTGGDGATRIIESDPSYPVPDLTVHPAANGTYLGTKKTPWGQSIRLQSSAPNTPLVETEVLLFDKEKKIGINYKVDKRYTVSKEGIYFAFPTAAIEPHFSYEIQQGWIDPAADLMKGGSAEWFSIQHWMAVHDGRLAVAVVPVDAPMATFGDIVRGRWPGIFQPKSSTLFSYVMNNYWHTNYAAGQGGVLNFRYIVTSGDHLAPDALTRLGWESMEPAEFNRVIVPDKIGDPDRPLPATGASFLEIDGGAVVLTDWKLAEDGRGTILRLLETAGKPAGATVRVPRLHLRAAALTNAVEDDPHPLEIQADSVQITLKPFEVVTLRLETADSN